MPLLPIFVTPTDVPVSLAVSDDSGQTDDARVISFAVVRAGCLSVSESRKEA